MYTKFEICMYIKYCTEWLLTATKINFATFFPADVTKLC